MEDKPATPPVIAATRGINKRYPGVQALAEVDFEVHAGEVRALLGANGAGKSTLIKILAGVEAPDSGTVEIGGTRLTGGVREATALGIATVYQELSLIPFMTVAENLFLGHWPRRRGGIDIAAMERAAHQTLLGVGVELDVGREVASLTLAEQQIVEIARAVQEEPRLLILDEPTSALAAHEVELVLEVVRGVSRRGVGVIYVSHRMDEIRRIADTVTVMRDGRHVTTTGIAGASTEHIIDLMLGDRASAEEVAYRARPRGEVKLRVRNLSLRPKLLDVSFEVRAGEILGIAGLLGSGRTELLRAIAGFDRPERAGIEINGRQVSRHDPLAIKGMGVGLTPENRKKEGIIAELSIGENIVMSDYRRVSSAGNLIPSRVAAAGNAVRERLSIKAANLDLSIATLSGGNQQKAVIGRWLHAGSDVLLLDEPTRGVDVGSKAQIYDIVRQLADEGAAVVFTSSELEELPLVCDRVIVLRGGRVVGEYQAPNIHTTQLLSAAMATSPEET